MRYVTIRKCDGNYDELGEKLGVETLIDTVNLHRVELGEDLLCP